jgi:predicted transcriptional regulator
MKNVMSVRLDTEVVGRLRELAKKEKKEVSTVARELIDQGWVFLTLREYREGKLSLGLVAKRLKMSLSEVIDLLSELGVRSPIEYDDYLKSYAAASEFLGGSK